MNEEKKLGRPLRFSEPAEIQDMWQVYKRQCDGATREEVSAGRVVTVSRPRVYVLQHFLAMAKISREVWADYRSYPDFSDTINEINAEVEGRKVQALLDGEGYGTGLIFDLKVNYGWQDKQVVESKGQVTSVEVTLKPAIDNAPIATDEKDVLL